jgi:cobalt/nickel transport system permease protein
VHLADGIVGLAPLVVALDLAGAGAVGVALSHGFGEGRRHVAWTGTLAAFALVAQALNIPLVPGASAHVVGAALLALALGPARAIVALTAVILVQALLFADGGISVLGLNVMNLAVLPVLSVALLRRLLGESPRALMAAAAGGAFLGNVAGATLLATTLVLSAGAPPATSYALLVGVQSLAGLVEGGLTALAVRALLGRAPALLASRPCRERIAGLDELTPEQAHAPRRGLRVAAFAVVAALALLPFSSATPDALELLLQRLGASP